jgi:hypothetical protein
MSKRLKENLNSKWVGAQHSLYAKRSKRKIIAYVESFDDISFWRTFLQDFEDDHCYFHVMLPSKDSLTKGKKAALMNLLKGSTLGNNMIVCIDSDYDYLIQGRNELSHYILSSPYVFHTYTYAIDNYLCYAPSLHNLCVQVTLNDRLIIDFKNFMITYSRVVFPLFVWCVWLHRIGAGASLTHSDFATFTSLRKVKVDQISLCLQDVERRVTIKINKLRRKYPKMVRHLKETQRDLLRLGVTPETTYLFMQGHHIVNNVVLRLLTPICQILRREREREIMIYAEHDEQYRNELSSYSHSSSSLETMLRKNINYKECYLYEYMRKDMIRFLHHRESIFNEIDI